MDFTFWLITFNGMSTNRVIALAGRYLLLGAPASFGSAIAAFELYAHINTRLEAPPMFDSMKATFAERLKMLATKPRIVFLRRLARVDISYVSRLGDAEELAPRSQGGGPMVSLAEQDPEERLKLFRAAAREIASTLLLVGPRLKGSDNFDWNAFATHLKNRLEQLPETTADLERLVEEIKAAPRPVKETRAVEPSVRALKKKPKLVAINHDEYHAAHVGKTADGAQFFLTNPFVPASDGDPGREFIALYIFEPDGKLREARIDDLGPRATLDAERARKMFERRLAELGTVKLGRIKVKPFQVERYGTVFGLVPELFDDGSDDWRVQAEPGNYMAFFKPWTSGEYDT